jgi:FkbM family methyltransferase
MRCISYIKLNDKLIYKALLPLKGQTIKLFSSKENVSYFVPTSAIRRFVEGADWKRYNANNLFPIIYSYLKSKNPTIVEVGSSWGEEVLYLSKLAGKKGKVYCFEPDPLHFFCLQQNKENLNLENTKLFNMGLSDEEQHIKVKTRTCARNKESLTNNEENVDAIKLVKLDDVINEKIDLIKIDTDGFDLDVILGSIHLIKEYKPVIVIEFLPTMEYSGLVGVDVLNKYEELGFQILLPQFHPKQDINLDNKAIVDLFYEKSFSMTHDLVLIYNG